MRERERDITVKHIKANALTNKPIGTINNFAFFTKAPSLHEKGDKMTSNIFEFV